MASSASKTMIEYPINLEWTISEDRIKALKDSATANSLASDKFTAVYASGVKYFLDLFPYDENQTKTWICLFLELGNEKKIEVEYKLSIKSANWDIQLHKVFEKSGRWGASCCSSDELFDPVKKFIVDGKFTVKVEGILKVKNAKPNQKCSRNFGDLWNTDFKDFIIVTEGKEIGVHKNVLACQSPVFAAMFKPHTKEAIEGKVEIPDITFDIVEKAIKLCYHHDIASDISIDEYLMFLKFADKYDIENLKDNLGEYLGDKLTVSNVCEISKCATATNAAILQNKCLDFITNCVSRKIFVPNMELLDKSFLVTVFANISCHESQTL